MREVEEGIAQFLLSEGGKEHKGKKQHSTLNTWFVPEMDSFSFTMCYRKQTNKRNPYRERKNLAIPIPVTDFLYNCMCVFQCSFCM